MPRYAVLLYYKFQAIADAAEYALAHRILCEELELRGRVLVAPEGINGTVSGELDRTEAYKIALSGDFPGIEFKEDFADEHAFKKLIVKARHEIISLGVTPKSAPAPTLEPEAWRARLDDENVVLLDGRNNYESELGRFQNAVCPDVESFRDFPAWLEANEGLLRGKTILTYCTGGIRCEKLSAYLLDRGHKDVFHLRGGICTYAQDPVTQGEGFEGVNVVFDERVVVSAGDKAKPLTACRECGEQTTNYVNCANVICNRRLILCTSCEQATERCCSEPCRQAPNRREKGAKLR